jgi:ubiquinone/menaquinone biosynthesis C-methylase UbiE
MEDPDRDAWQKPDEVIRALGVRSGQVVCDIGSGPGYFALRLGRAVGDEGAVFAVDVEPKVLEVLRDRIAKSGLRNVSPILALPDDPLIPRGACDLILIVDTFHHFPDQVVYLRRLGRSLKKGSRIANIDFHKKDLPVGPPSEHKISRDEFITTAATAGFKVKTEETFLPYQYFLVLEPSAKK